MKGQVIVMKGQVTRVHEARTFGVVRRDMRDRGRSCRKREGLLLVALVRIVRAHESSPRAQNKLQATTCAATTRHDPTKPTQTLSNIAANTNTI